MAKRLDFSESSSLHSHRHPADKWDGRGRPSLPLWESNLLGHSTQTRWFAEFWGWRAPPGMRVKFRGRRRSTGVPGNTASLAGGQASRLSWPTGFQPVVSLADRRDALSALTGWKPVLQSTSAKMTVLGVPGASAGARRGGEAVIRISFQWLIQDKTGGSPVCQDKPGRPIPPLP